MRTRPPTSPKLVSPISYLFFPTPVSIPSLLKLTLSALPSPAPLLPGSLLLRLPLPSTGYNYCKTMIASGNFKIIVIKRSKKYFKLACILFWLYFGVLPQNVVMIVIIIIIIIINKGLTLKMASAQVVETSFTNNCSGFSNLYGNQFLIHFIQKGEFRPTHKFSFPCLSGGKNISLQNSL